MKESVAVAKEADAKKGVSATKSDNSVHRARNEQERQLGSLRAVIDNVRRDGGRPSVESIATELSGMHKAQRAPALLALQQTHGNRYVQRVVAGIQAKLKVGQPNDIYEQEADRVALAVTRMSEPCVLRREAGEVPGQIPEVTQDLESRINALRGGGQPLPESVRIFFGARFGHDFSNVRIRTDTRAAEAARGLDARAFTVGRDVIFGAGQYAPGTSEGRQLLAHELTHTIQQGATRQGVPSSLEKSNPVDTAKKEADTTTRVFLQEQSHTLESGETLRIARLEEASPTAEPAAETLCIPGPGIPPTNCSAYAANSGWLPFAYVNNATCACLTTPNSPTANCVRKFLQDRLAATPTWLKAMVAMQKINDNPATYPVYSAFVQTFLTPRIYRDHVDAYSSCCCPSGPAPYPAWIGVTTVPIRPCSLVGLTIRYFGSCHGTPGRW